MAAASQPKITLYTVGTPNGQKVSIALEELGIPYAVKKINFGTMEQKEEWFLKINPNGRIPAIVDHSRGDFPVFESGAILLYLAEHHDPEHVLAPVDANGKSEVVQWIMWQMGGLGPMQGQANHFYRYAPEKIPYGIKRYQEETLRLYRVMERQLEGRDWLAGGQFTAADIACFGWVAAHAWAGLSLDETPRVAAWLRRCAARKGVVDGMNVPDANQLIQNDFKIVLSEEEQKKRAAEATKWILETQEAKK